MLRPLAILAALSLISAAQVPPPPAALPGLVGPPKTVLSVKAVMRHIVNPAAELYWKAGGEVDTEAGAQHRAPTPEDAARWNATIDAAYTLQESGNLLMLQGRARDDDRWMKLSQQLVDAGVLAVAAAEAHDPAKTFAAGSALYDACFACHGRYIPRPANSLYTHKTPDEDFKPPK